MEARQCHAPPCEMHVRRIVGIFQLNNDRSTHKQYHFSPVRHDLRLCFYFFGGGWLVHHLVGGYMGLAVVAVQKKGRNGGTGHPGLVPPPFSNAALSQRSGQEDREGREGVGRERGSEN